ncbi:MAG: hypothetical protein JW910_19730 [Anaerolineae bacterium]|nr:hypothetical protein [Anaerolineae bacterium]
MTRTRQTIPYRDATWEFPMTLGAVLIVAAVAWVVVFAVFLLLDIDVQQGAAAGYWQASESIGLSFNPRYLPVYPALIGVLHDLLPSLTPALLMQLISLVGWLLSCICVYLILETAFVELTWQGALFYALFPFVGVFEVVYPRADGVAAFLLTLGLLAYLHKRRILTVIAFAVGLLTHQALWLFIPLILLAGITRQQKRLTLFEGLISAVPLVVYLMYGVFRTRDALWFVQASTNLGEAAPGTLIVFDGLAGLITRGDVTGWLTFAGLVIVIALALLLVLSGSWRGKPWLLALIVPVLVFAVVLNRDSIWTLGRYSVFLVLPLWVYLDEAFVWQIGPLKLRPVLPILLALAFASQLVTAYAVSTGSAPLLFTGS